MTHSSADLLELDALKALIGRYVSSPAGRRELDRIAPSSDRAVLEEALAETGEAIAYLAAASQPQAASRGAAVRLRFDAMPDGQPHLAKLAIAGMVLEGLEIRDLTTLLDRACDTRAVLRATAGRFPLLGARASRIAEFRPMLTELSGKIEPDGRVADNASVALQRIRRELERHERLIQESLERFLRLHRDDGILQEEFVTIRNERWVLPIVAGQKKKIEGIIHAASGTGHTLFIEPLESVELNNDLVRLREQEQREVFRILEEITARFRAAAEDLRESFLILGELEMLFAKARFASDYHCIVPCFAGDGAARLRLERARHPLLVDVLNRQGRKVVPLSLTLDPESRTLLISGPNTGGKTVALKTVGLLALMAQSGLPVPAETAEFPVFDQVLADIGDHQSLEQSLSTFSAHITRIQEILKALGPNSLVLLDELGRATDPEEGGALGVAILDHMRRSGAFTLASTHLVAPKVYGATTEGVLNGAMSFDEQTLEPTYVLRTGAPGASAGLDIAGRLGLPSSLIDQARATLASSQRDLARLLKLLEERLDSVAREESELAEARRKLEADQAQWKTQADKREAAKLKEIERRTDLLLEQFETRAKETIERIAASADQRKLAAQAARKVAGTRRELREEMETEIFSARHEPQPQRPAVKEGARVRLRGVREPARVKRLMGADALEVEAGFLRLQVSLDDVLEVLPDAPESAKLPKGVSVHAAPRTEAALREINVIGKRAEEALAEVDKFLDTAALAGVSQVRIVHGHGMGILKRAVAEMLKDHPHIARFSQDEPGATLAELRE